MGPGRARRLRGEGAGLGSRARCRSSTAPAYRAPARRWKTQLNENAEAAAFWSELPEADHNEICGWERGRTLAPFAGVFLEDADQHPRITPRVELTAAEVRARRRARGADRRARRHRLERVLSLVLLGDLVASTSAVLAGVDPTPVEPIDGFKCAQARPLGTNLDTIVGGRLSG